MHIDDEAELSKMRYADFPEVAFVAPSEETAHQELQPRQPPPPPEFASEHSHAPKKISRQHPHATSVALPAKSKPVPPPSRPKPAPPPPRTKPQSPGAAVGPDAAAIQGLGADFVAVAQRGLTIDSRIDEDDL